MAITFALPNPRIALCGVALLLSGAIQLRYESFGVGIGELCGALFLLVSAFNFKLNIWRQSDISYIGCACVFFVAASLGALYNNIRSISETNSINEGFAIGYAVILGGLAAKLAVKNRNNFISIVRYLSLAAVAWTVLFAAWFLYDKSIFGINIWFEEAIWGSALPRFVGWGANPNQIGIYISALPFFVLISFQMCMQKVEKIYYSAIFLLLLIVEFLIRSDAVFIGWFAALIVGASIKIYHFRSQRISRFAILFLLLSLIGLFVYILSSAIEGAITKTDAADGNGRFPLWLNAVRAWSSSPFIGLGFGSHSGGEAPFQNYEAHSLPLDLLTMGGVLGTLPVFIVVLFYYHKLIQSRQILPIMSLTSILAQCLVHYTGRHPIFWFGLATSIAVVGLSKANSS